ncbi:hypothetical protein PPL_02285 [Heterostelium album PN500]|uniref:Uncharacterized protein n=1 Tax=Heterostelium pallidum (strain ATCC 26659 / Pp 5 / PN500) TaxID=670386 RepID=D3B1W0_HETP5|nr:hypothetical protein PPL_02285 [Heterostelium album PN500]EFA85284.1 hypothetical protein PPL_02285 [Heterostelium album PN500]|eukprot:XP_020437393.1 hypothetical protein PPL_02285 [Heterostelium album PN500]
MKLIQLQILKNTIDSQLELFSKPKSFKEYYEDETYGRTGNQEVYFECFTLRNQLLDYALVCKNWFQYVSINYFNAHYLAYNSRNNQYLSKIKESIFSLFQVANIKELFFFDTDYHKSIGTALEHIRKLTSLERINLHTVNYELATEINRTFPHLKLQLVLIDYIMEDFSFSNLDSIEFVHMDINDLAREIIYDGPGFELDFSIFDRWRVNSMFLEYDEACGGGVYHISYSKLFQIQTLRYLTIDKVDHVNASELVDSINDHLVRLKISVLFSGFSLEEEDNVSYVDDEESKEYCNMCDNMYNHKTEIISTHRLSHWVDFCSKLATNKTLEKLSLSNYCKAHVIKSQDVTQISYLLSQSLTSNNTLKSLAISCYVLDEAFFQSLSQYKSINSLKLYDLTQLHLQFLCAALKTNNTIQYLNISSYADPHQKEAFAEFLTSLDDNNTLSEIKVAILFEEHQLEDFIPENLRSNHHVVYKEFLQYRQLYVRRDVKNKQ